MSVFTDKMKSVEKPKRNVFDLTFSNSGTYKMGYLYPVFVKEVLPSESMRIKPSFGLRLDPTIFPLQTKLRADLHFFYVRNRNLWKNWENFMSNCLPAGSTFPYLDQPAAFYETCKLADYMGVPTSIFGGFNSIYLGYCYTTDKNLTNQFSDTQASIWETELQNAGYLVSPSQVRLPFPFGLKYDGADNSWNIVGYDWDWSVVKNLVADGSQFSAVPTEVAYVFYDDLHVPSHLTGATDIKFNLLQGGFLGCPALLWVLSNPDGSAKDGIKGSTKVCGFVVGQLSADGSFNIDYDAFNTLVADAIEKHGSCFFALSVDYSDFGLASPTSYFDDPDKPAFAFPTSMSFPLYGEWVRESSDIPEADHPFVNGEVPISALPFRAYRSIYNTYYRDNQNDPIIENGKPAYNTFLENDGDGADDFDYKLERRRWEADQFISAMQSPQQGVAPLVGIETNFANGTATLQFQVGNNTDDPDVGQIEVDIDADGETISGVRSMSGVNQATLNEVMNQITTGISINSLRNVNSLQRWLEKNIYLGYRYKDQIKSHFGVDARFEVLDMPEFIGGTSKIFDLGEVLQTVPTENGSLGSFAGQGSLFKESNHDINQYCDEWGYIIGILSIHPVPTYSQNLPKHFTKVHNPLDFFSPEFNHIGFQPITYGEVCPLQTYGENNTVFGYQKAWYDYMSSLDECHGLFRTSLKDYILMRVYDTKPSLTNPDFLYVDEEQLNDVFPTIQSDAHHIKGMLHFDCQAKLPIAKFGLPRLE